MKKNSFLLAMVLGIFCGAAELEKVFGQTPCGTTFRRPSESDLAWLLGEGNTANAMKRCGPLRNPACSCQDCGKPDTSSTQTLRKFPPPSEHPIQQVGHFIESEETVENPNAAPPTTPIRTVSGPKAMARPQPDVPDHPPTVTPQKLKTAAKTSAAPMPSPCSENEKSTCNTSMSSCKQRCCVPSFGLTDDLFSWGASLHRTRTQHSSCCVCSCCLVFDVPDMIGDTGQIPYRFVAVQTPGSLLLHSQPTSLMSRLNLAEHFNVEAKNRIWFDYRHLSGAVELIPQADRSRAVDRFTVGAERKISVASSLEFRLPVFHQISSSQPGGEAKTEIGNISLTYKMMFFRTADLTFGGGLAVVCPTAEDWRYSDAGLKATYDNKAINLIPYLGVLWHPNISTFGQLLVQADIPVSKNTLQQNNQSLSVREPSLLRAGVQLGRWLYRNEKGRQSCRLGGFLEVNYVAALDDPADIALSSTGTLFLSGSTKSKTQVLTVGGGIPIQFGKLSMTNAIIAPISNDRAFSVAYDFSLCRRF